MTTEPNIDGIVHLINVGDVGALQAQRIQPGMVRRYNYDYRHAVVKVERKGGFIHITVVDEKGKEWTQRRRPKTLIAILGWTPHRRM